MARAWRLVALGAGAYLLILVATFPAAFVSGMLQRKGAELTLNGVSGSVFSGQAARLVYQQMDLGPVHWRLRPLALLLGRFEYRLELSSPANHGSLHIGKSLTGRTLVHEMDLELQPDRLINHYSPLALHTSGTVRLDFETFNPQSDFTGKVNGRLVLQDAVLLEPVSLVLGKLKVDVVTEDGELVGQITDGGELGARGEMALSATYAYRVMLLFKPGNDVSADTLQALELIAQRQPNGDYRIDMSGQL